MQRGWLLLKYAEHDYRLKSSSDSIQYIYMWIKQIERMKSPTGDPCTSLDSSVSNCCSIYNAARVTAAQVCWAPLSIGELKLLYALDIHVNKAIERMKSPTGDPCSSRQFSYKIQCNLHTDKCNRCSSMLSTTLNRKAQATLYSRYACE
jgi:hypothetical protein